MTHWDATTPGQSGPGSDGNERVFCILKSSQLKHRLNWIWCGCHNIYIYIYSHSFTNCFVISQLFCVARYTRFSKLESKPGWFIRQLKILPHSYEETSVREGILNAYLSFSFVYIYPLNSYRELNSFEEPYLTRVATVTSFARVLNPIMCVLGGAVFLVSSFFFIFQCFFKVPSTEQQTFHRVLSIWFCCFQVNRKHVTLNQKHTYPLLPLVMGHIPRPAVVDYSRKKKHKKKAKIDSTRNLQESFDKRISGQCYVMRTTLFNYHVDKMTPSIRLISLKPINWYDRKLVEVEPRATILPTVPWYKVTSQTDKEKLRS